MKSCRRSCQSDESTSVFRRTQIKRGDVETALKASAHVVRGTWTTQRIEHLFLEPESALAEPIDDGRLRVYSGGQGIFDDQRQIAAFLQLPLDAVVVEQVSAGGAFGGKEDMSVQAQTALLAWKTRRPVKLTLNREESVRIHPKRHPMSMEYIAGCDANGMLTAVRARITGDSGAYASVGERKSSSAPPDTRAVRITCRTPTSSRRRPRIRTTRRAARCAASA